MADYELRDLEIFCGVVEHQGFTRAARALRLSQAAVSERVARLEDAVGARLLDRLGRRVEPTALGRVLHERARALLTQRDALDQELSAARGLVRGRVVLGASTIPGEYLLPAAVARFRAAHPEARVEVRIADSAEVATRVLAGDHELGVVGAPPRSAHLEAVPLWRDELVLVLPPGHPLARKRKPVEPRALTAEPLLVREPGSGTRALTEEAFVQAGVDPDTLSVVAELGSTAAVKEGVLQGLGLAVLSARAVSREREAGLLATARLAAPLERRFQLLRDRRRDPSPLARALWDQLQDGAP